MTTTINFALNALVWAASSNGSVHRDFWLGLHEQAIPLWRLILQGPSLWPDPLAGNPGLLYSSSWVLKE